MKKIKTGKFPSPCGEKVGINCQDLGVPGFSRSQFPSPCGEKVGINRFQVVGVTDGYDVYLVSVPLRGKGRDQP